MSAVCQCAGHEHRFGPMRDCALLDCTCPGWPCTCGGRPYEIGGADHRDGCGEPEDVRDEAGQGAE